MTNKHQLRLNDFNFYLFVGTAGTQCFATSAEFPFKTRTDLQRCNFQLVRMMKCQKSQNAASRVIQKKNPKCTSMQKVRILHIILTPQAKGFLLNQQTHQHLQPLSLIQKQYCTR